jgi:oligopeptide/dipeptide ABC transporter ATP-binding protein
VTAVDEPGAPVLELRAVHKRFTLGRRGRAGRRAVRAVDGADLVVAAGQTVGLVGESGSGKSTLARLVVGLTGTSQGTVLLHGRDVTRAGRSERRLVRASAQMVFQDPYSSFDPMWLVRDSLAEPLRARGTPRAERDARVEELAGLVGLAPQHLARYPAQLSGGQLQRAAIARALTVSPELLVLDEPVSALDVSTQAQVINLLMDLQERFAFACLFISHDLSVVRQVSDEIAVMYLGRIVERGPVEEVYRSPRHPYTAALLSAIPRPTPGARRLDDRIVLEGDVPSPVDPPSGCRFRTRCPFAMDVCATSEPPPTASAGSVAWCHLHTEGPHLAGRSVLELPLPHR